MDLSHTYWMVRRYQEALDACERTVELVPDPSWSSWPHLYEAFVHWTGTGRLDLAREALEKVDPGHSFWAWSWYWQALFEGDYPGALEVLDGVPSGWIRMKVAKRPVSLFAAVVYEAAGDPTQAWESYAAARQELEAALAKEPNDPHLLSSMGLALAGLGEGDEALANGLRGAELHPISNDAFYGVPHVIDIAHIHVLLGQDEEALDQLEYLLSIPSWLSPIMYRNDPRWKRLHDHPRFRQMVSLPEPTYERADG
jgi:tetratricopeptide (TPR) repeat protein